MNPPPDIVKIRVNKLAANIVGNALGLLLCVGGIVLAHHLPHFSPRISTGRFFAFVGYLAALVPLHEGLHAAGLMVFGRVAWRDLRFGIMWRALMPYCHCTVPITLHAYRRMAIAPLVVTGAIAIGWLLLIPHDLTGLTAGLTLATCVGDVWMVLKLRGFADQLRVQDCPSDVGCDLLPPAPAPES